MQDRKALALLQTIRTAGAGHRPDPVQDPLRVVLLESLPTFQEDVARILSDMYALGWHPHRAASGDFRARWLGAAGEIAWDYHRQAWILR